MKITNEGINLIKKFEGLRLEAYLCPARVWTIGYGHTKGVKKGQVITQLEADNLLKEDLSSFEKGVTSLIKSNINQNQFDSLVSFAFNLGLANLKSSTLLKKVNANPNDRTIVDEFLKWVYAKKVFLEGLHRRRQAEANLYFTKYINKMS